ncbi:MAG: hypothetical protein ABI528_09900 [bacterium]
MSSFEKPSIELSYGQSDISIKDEKNVFGSPGMIELKLGFTSIYSTPYSNKVEKYINRFLFLSNASTDISADKNSTGLNNRLWRFGMGSKEGYGIKLGSFSVMPYSSNSISWSRFDYTVPAFVTATDLSYTENLKDAFRFGSISEAGINLQLTKGVSIQPKYEIADIYPRHLFGKQMLSSLIEYSGLFMIDNFTTAVLKNAPVAGAVVNFILKNAYEFGFYQLRKDKMNWPFTSEAPLRYNTFKLGMSFTF